MGGHSKVSTGAAVISKELLSDLRADLRRLCALGDALVPLLAELDATNSEEGSRAPGTPREARCLAEAQGAAKQCTARSRLAICDVSDALVSLRQTEGAERPPGWAAEALRQWLQPPGATALLEMKGLRYCKQAFETEDYWTGGMQAREERCLAEDPLAPNWVLDVVPYDGGYWALNGHILFALLGADKARPKHKYSGLARVRFWPLNSVVRIEHAEGEEDAVLSVFFRLLKKEHGLQEEMLAKSGSESDTESSESTSSSPSHVERKRVIDPTSSMSSWPVAKVAKTAEKKPELPVAKEHAECASPGNEARGEMVKQPAAVSENKRWSVLVPQPAASSGASACEGSGPGCAALQDAIAAAEAVQQYRSNKEGSSGWFLLYLALQESAASLPDASLRNAVIDLVEEMRQRYKSNTASSYREPATQILKILAEAKRGSFDPSGSASQVSADPKVSTSTGGSAALPKECSAATGTPTPGRSNTQKTTLQEATSPGAGKEGGLPEEVQRVLAASDALAAVDSNLKGGGGAAVYHAARGALEEAATSLDEHLRVFVLDRLEHLRKTFKANTPGSYRSVCKDIREFLVKDVT